MSDKLLASKLTGTALTKMPFSDKAWLFPDPSEPLLATQGCIIRIGDTLKGILARWGLNLDDLTPNVAEGVAFVALERKASKFVRTGPQGNVPLGTRSYWGRWTDTVLQRGQEVLPITVAGRQVVLAGHNETPTTGFYAPTLGRSAGEVDVTFSPLWGGLDPKATDNLRVLCNLQPEGAGGANFFVVAEGDEPRSVFVGRYSAVGG